METEYLKEHFDMRVYSIVGHLEAKLDAVEHVGDTRIVKIKIKDGEDTYLAMRLEFGVDPEGHLKELTIFGDLCKGLLESGRNKFTASMYTRMSPLFLFASKIGAKIDFSPIFNKLTEGCSDDQFTLFSDKEGSLFNGKLFLDRSFLLREIDGSEGIAHIVKVIDDTDFSGNGDISLVFDASKTITCCRVNKGEKETETMLFTKAIVHEWSNTTYGWMIGSTAEKLYNAWKTIRFKCNIKLNVVDDPCLKRVVEDKLGLFFTSLVCNQSYYYAEKQSEHFLKLKEGREKATGRSFTFKTIEFGGEGDDMCYQPTIIINTEYGEKQGA